MASHVQMEFSITMLKSVRDMRPSCVVHFVAGKAGTHWPLCIGTTFWWAQKFSKSPHRWGPPPYPSKVWMRRSLSRVLYAFCRSRKTRKTVSWSMLARFCMSFSSIIAVLVPLPAWNQCSTSRNWILAYIRVSGSASTTF